MIIDMGKYRGKDRKTRSHARRPRPGEQRKREERKAQFAGTLPIQDDGAGARSPEDPQRHHRPAAERGPKTCPTPQACMDARTCLHGCVQGP